MTDACVSPARQDRIAFAAPAVQVSRDDDGALILRHGLALEPYDRHVGVWVRRWAERASERVALGAWDEAGALHTVDYGTLRADVDRISQGLLDRGLSAATPIALLSDKSIPHALLTLAALQVGIPVAPISPAYSLRAEARERLRFCLATIAPRLVLVNSRDTYADAIRLLPASTEVLTDDDVAGIGVTPVSVDAAFDAVDADAAAKILFTSGSTGNPKPVINTHRMMCSNARAQAQLFPFLTARPPVVVDWQPWHHCGGSSHNYHAALSNGGSYYIDSGKPTTSDAFAPTLHALRTISPTVHFNVPLGYERLAFHLDRDGDLARSFFAELDCLVTSAASMPKPLWAAYERLSAARRGQPVAMVSSYGMTEMAPLHTSLHWHEGAPGRIGLPIPGSLVKLVPVDDRLELRAKGPNISPGYFGQPDLSAGARDAQGWFRSGDSVRLADPADPAQGLVYDGRLTDQFKLLSGTWVQVNRLRTDVLAACAPWVEDVLVVGAERAELGLLVIPNLAACRELLDDPALTLDQACRAAAFLDRLRKGIAAHNAGNSASSRRIARLLPIDDVPSLARGETTDKGHVNQALSVRNRPHLVARLFGDDAPDVLVMPHVLMLRIASQRIASAVLMVFLILLFVFVVLRQLPIDPVGMSLPPGSTEADRIALTRQFGLDRPVAEQYVIWVDGLLHGDLGLSVNLRRAVGPMIGSVLPATLELVLVAMLIGVVCGVAGGLLLFAARRTRLEIVGDVFTSIIVSVPDFVWAIGGILLFGVWLHLLPFIGRLDPDKAVPVHTGLMLIDTLIAGRPAAFANAFLHLLLPSAALGLTLAPLVTRVLRSSLLGVFVEDFIELARLRGLSEYEVLTRHALRNAALPTLSLIGVQAGFMFGGTLLVEVIFGWPGLGNLMVTAVRTGDIPVIQAATLIYCLGVLLITLLVDLTTIALNPRLRTR